MTRLLRSPFPVAPKAPSLLQHDLFGGPPVALDAADDSTPSTPAMRRWCEIGITDDEAADAGVAGQSEEPAFTDRAWAQGASNELSAERHGSRPGQLSRPGHSNGGRNLNASQDRELAILDRTLRTHPPRAAALLSTPEATSCGRAAGHRAAAGRSTKDRSSRSVARKRPIIIRRRRVEARHAAPVAADVRNATAEMIEATGRISLETLPMATPTQAQPEWSCATTWLRSAEAPGEGSMHQVTAAASYMFVAAMLAFTFVI